jgi:carboxylesterase type B
MYLGSSSITGNMGFLDQHMALKWVHENARSFNGDPNRITLGGQSAGSFSVHYHVTYPPSWPYFRNVVHQSGSIFTSKRVFISTCEASKRANAIINSLGCLSTMNVPDRLECIQNHTQLESKTLLTAASAYKEQLLGHNEYAATLNPLFPLVQNCHDFNMTVAEYFEKDTHVFKSDMNMIVGYNKDEGGFFLDSDFLENSDQKVKTYTVNYTRFEFFIDNFYYYFPNYPKRMSQTFKKSLMATYTVPKKNDFFQTLIKLLGEHVYICPSVDYVSFYSNFNKSAKVYRYSYDYRSKASLKGQAYGVTHGEQKKIW